MRILYWHFLSAFAASSDYYLLVYYVCAGDIGEGAILKGILSSSYAIAGLVYIKILSTMSSHWGLGRSLFLVFILNGIGGTLKWWIFTPAMANWVWLDAVFCSAVWSAMIVIVPNMLSSICLKDQLGTGLVGSIQAWIASTGGLLALIGFGLTLKVVGFDASLMGAQEDNTLLFLRGLLSIGTLFFSVLCLAVLFAAKKHLEHYKLW